MTMTKGKTYDSSYNLKMNFISDNYFKGNTATMKTSTLALVLSTALLAGCSAKPDLN